MLFEKQEYQEKCVENILTALDGIDFDSPDLNVLRQNLQNIENPKRFETKEQFRLDVLMETGTGKTFVYLKTIFELHKQLGLKKFMIVVPRLAIKSGVLQQIQLTKAEFYRQYRQHLNVIDYRGEKSLSDIQHNLVKGDSLTVLLINNSAFNSAKNLMRKHSETLYQYGNTWGAIAASRPVVIIDEPHLLRGEKTTEVLDQLTESLFIRFGATYPDEEKDKLSNVVYALDSISSFNQFLVKGIGVSTVFASGEESGVRVSKIRKGEFDLVYSINEGLRKQVVRIGEDIGVRTDIARYKGVNVARIFTDKVALSNHEVLELQSGNYTLSDVEIRQMLKKAIRIHFEKEEQLFEQDIKSLSLFFIPGVNDFRGDSPRVKTIFEEEYKEIRQEFYDATKNADYKAYLDKDFEDGELQVHEGYFSGDRGNKEEKERQGVDLILNDKEKLLSFETPLRFVFSVWALQEGWDNPNIFTICKLHSTGKDIARRQQVGRGLRLAVNQQGKRLTFAHFGEDENKFYEVNELDMVVSGQETDFIHGIQSEIESVSFTLLGDIISQAQLVEKGLTNRVAAKLLEILLDGGMIEYRKEDDEEVYVKGDVPSFLAENKQLLLERGIKEADYEEIKNIFSNNSKNRIKDKTRKIEMVSIRREGWDRFKELWETINKKSRLVYGDIDEEALMASIAEVFNKETINPVLIRVTRQTYDAKENEIKKEEPVEELGDAEFFKRQTMAKFLTEFSEKEKLPLPFVVRLFAHLNKDSFKNDPTRARKLLIHLIREKIHETIICRVRYQFAETSIYANALQDENGILIDKIKHTDLGRIPDSTVAPKDEYLYDKVVFDSQVEREAIVEDYMATDKAKVTVFAKLPRIRIPTPYKTYNPDFAYVVECSDGKQVFLVVETKGYEHAHKIPAEEQKKIEYGEKFFATLQEQLPDVKISYKKRLKRDSLEALLREICK